MKSVWKNPWFLIGFIFIAGLLLSSFVYSGVTDNQVPKHRWIYDADGKIIGGSPQPPSWKTPLGTDKLGYDMFAKAIIGAKYTILAALSVAALRILIAVPIGMIMGVYFKKGKRYINGFIDSFHFIPFTILAYYLLHPILWMPEGGFHTSMFERLALEVIILALLTVPIISILISNEAGRVIEQEFVLASRTLGASKIRLMFKHVFPALREKVFVLFGQQMMQTLIVFAHLGLLKLFLGGTKVSYDPFFGDPPQTISNEWSGLIGDTYKLLEWIPWVPLTPIVCFALTMIAVSFMIEGYVQATSGHSHYFKKNKRDDKPAAVPVSKENANQEDLQLYRKTS